jgi:hypothetical protein
MLSWESRTTCLSCSSAYPEGSSLRGDTASARRCFRSVSLYSAGGPGDGPPASSPSFPLLCAVHLTVSVGRDASVASDASCVDGTTSSTKVNYTASLATKLPNVAQKASRGASLRWDSS